MKTQSKQVPRHFQLKILAYGNSYYVDRLARLEAALARKPRLLQIDMVGVGEIPADSALLIRSVLVRRNANTRIITNARSSLQGGSVLVWLLGDTRIIRDDARVYFRPVDVSEIKEPDETLPWKEDKSLYWDSPTGIDPEEGDYARVLQLINEFLPVRELAGRLIEVPVLRQFGLVENEKVDRFLAAAFGKQPETAGGAQNSSEEKSTRRGSKSLKSRQIQR
jgi:hypothetical protein